MSEFKETLKTHRVTEGGVSYYIKKASELESLETNKVLFPQSSAIINAFYLPYLKSDSFESGQVTSVDVKIPTVDGVKYEGNVGRLNYLTQAQRLQVLETEVSVHQNYETSQKTLGGEWRWQNEGKCHLYPYSYFMYTDGICDPLIIYPQFVPYDSSYKLAIRQYLNMNGIYQLSLNGYRGDYIGMYHGVQCQGITIPTAQSTYVDWKIANKNQRIMNYVNQGINTVSGVVTGAMTGGVVGGITGAVSGVMGIASSIASEKDMQNQPNAIINRNADFSFMQQFNMTGEETEANLYGGLALRQIHYRYRDEDMERIGQYFHYYGTKQNRFMTPSITSRTNFNYLKGEILLESQSIPKRHLAKLKEIFKNGVTVWHMDTPNNFIGNYTPDNTER